MSSSLAHSSAPPSVTDFGDARAEFAALVSKAAVFDLSGRAKISISGGDRVRWLNGMVTNNIRDLALGQGVYAFLLNPQGHILGDLYAYNRGDSLTIDTDQSQVEKLLATFDHYIIMDDVEVTNLSEKLSAIGIAGLGARGVLHRPGIESGELQPLQLAEVKWRDLALTIVRGDNPVVEEYELWMLPEHASVVRDELINAGAKPVGASALELLRIAAGIPRYGQDIRERDLPQETEQARALHFSKGCYIGQEIVERIRSRGAVHRKFTGFEVTGPLPAVGTKIQLDGREIGEVTSTAFLPQANGEFGAVLGYIRRDAAVAGKQVRAGQTQLVVSTLPFAKAFPQPQ